MIINKQASNLILDTVIDKKTISKVNITQEDMDNWCHTLNEIAGLEYNDAMFNGVELSRYLVPTIFKDLVIPRKIGVEEGRRYNDLRGDIYSNYNPANYGFGSVSTLRPLAFNVISECILGSQKVKAVEGSTVNKITDLNGEKSLNEYSSRGADIEQGCMDEWYVIPASKPYIPICFKIAFRNDKYATENYDLMFEEWLEDALTNLSTNNNKE